MASRHGAHVTELSADLDLRSSRSAVTEWKEVHYGCNRSTQLVTCALNSGDFVFVFCTFYKPGSKRGLKTEVIWTEMEYDAIILSEKVKLANCLASKCSGSQLMLFIYWKRWFFLKKNKIAHQSMHSSIFL